MKTRPRISLVTVAVTVGLLASGGAASAAAPDCIGVHPGSGRAVDTTCPGHHQPSPHVVIFLDDGTTLQPNVDRGPGL